MQIPTNHAGQLENHNKSTADVMAIISASPSSTCSYVNALTDLLCDFPTPGRLIDDRPERPMFGQTSDMPSAKRIIFGNTVFQVDFNSLIWTLKMPSSR